MLVLDVFHSIDAVKTPCLTCQISRLYVARASARLSFLAPGHAMAVQLVHSTTCLQMRALFLTATPPNVHRHTSCKPTSNDFLCAHNMIALC